MRNKDYIEGWKHKLDVFFKIIIFASGVYQTLFGETAIGIFTLLALAVILLPSFFSRNFIKKIPIEIEMILLLMVLIQLVLGEARDFYNNIPYYDKFVHLMLPFLVGYISFLLFYTMHATGRLKATTQAMIVTIFLMTLGVGAFWEILEYTSDEVLYPRIPGWHHFQGNDQEDPLHDTMNDLIMDGLGGIFGVLLGIYFVGRSERANSKRLNVLIGEVAEVFRKT